MIKVSVIVPIYNVEQYLEQCLDSICNQTLKDIEIICINDGSTDGSLKILESYAKKDNRIKIIDKQNEGYGKAMNVGLDNATGKYIGIVESDDFIESNMYDDLYKIAMENDLDIVKSCFYDNLQSSELTQCKKPKWDDELIPKNTFTSYECPLFLVYHPSIWSCVYRAEFIKANNIRFVEAPGSGWTDNPFQVQTMCLAQKITYTPNAYYYWRRLNKDESDSLKDYSVPFKRSDEIHQWLNDNHITDVNILGCLYERELAYIQIILDKKYLPSEFKEVCSLIDAMSARMDLNAILTCGFIKKRNRRKLLEIKRNIKIFYWKRQLKKFRKNLISIKWKKDEKSITLFNKTRRANG